MTAELNKRAEKYRKAHRRRLVWYRVLGVLAAVTVFVTTYALILPAITKEPSPGVRISREFFYENEEVLMQFTVEGRAVFEDESIVPEGLSDAGVSLSVTPVDDESSAFGKYLQYADENIGSEDLRKLLVVRLAFDYDGLPLDMRNCEIVATLTPKSELLHFEDQPVVSDANESVYVKRYLSSGTDAEGDRVLALSSIGQITADLSEQDTAFLSDGAENVSLSTRLSENSDVMAFALYSTINPKFTVQYYSHVTVFDDDGDVSIKVIDASDCKLPTNTKNLPMVDAYLNYDSKAGAYVMAMHTELAPLYTAKEYEYVKAPGVAYIDRNRTNGNFILNEVWVLKAGKSATSTNVADWDVYPATVSFTNRAASASANRIYIAEDAVIRLIYNEVDGGYTNDATFYDYDITDGYIYTSATTNTKTQTSKQTNNTVWYGKTTGLGINSFSASSGTVKLAFGNANTNTGLKDVLWVDANGVSNTLNMYNSASVLGCTFGLVQGINADGTLKYASGVSAPVLFGSKAATGKTILDGYSLQFNRTGDTYVLTSVNGTRTQNLQYFTNPSPYDGKVYTTIYTNNFWPMDYAPTFGANGHDLKFGSYSYRNNRKLTTGANFPQSDDGLDHNSYFGLNYEVEFELTEDYLGHLEYIFYGDDDMWVFLDGQLVCDIGGVHSSVGQYVDLWDYINKMPEEEKYGKHKLSFYYTERGASGSTCYMQFTLPSVSIDTPQIESNTLEVGKTVENYETDMEFEFFIELFDQNGNALADDYSYTVHDADGTALYSDIINADGRYVMLAHGQYVEIGYLPEHVRYRITETRYNGFHTTYRINGSEVSEGYVAEGSLSGDTRVQFTNSTGMMLPATGGIGMGIFLVPFVLAIAAGTLPPLLWHLKKKRQFGLNRP